MPISYSNLSQCHQQIPEFQHYCCSQVSATRSRRKQIFRRRVAYSVYFGPSGDPVRDAQTLKRCERFTGISWLPVAHRIDSCSAPSRPQRQRRGCIMVSGSTGT